MGYPKLEYKYLFRTEQTDAIRERFAGMCTLDKHAQSNGRGEYTVRSVYFDSRDMRAYEEKIEGVKYRRKFRVRVYETMQEDSIAFLEIKRKEGVLLTKYRAPLLARDLEDFFVTRDIEKYVRKNGGDGVDREHARRFLYHYYRASLQPAVLVTYDREPYVGIQNPDLRLTLDKNLRSHYQPHLQDVFREDVLSPSFPGFGIFEVKFTSGVPRWLRSVIHEFSLKRLALSKYTICLDWHRRHKCACGHRGLSVPSLDTIGKRSWSASIAS